MPTSVAPGTAVLFYENDAAEPIAAKVIHFVGGADGLATIDFERPDGGPERHYNVPYFASEHEGGSFWRRLGDRRPRGREDAE